MINHCMATLFCVAFAIGTMTTAFGAIWAVLRPLEWACDRVAMKYNLVGEFYVFLLRRREGRNAPPTIVDGDYRQTLRTFVDLYDLVDRYGLAGLPTTSLPARYHENASRARALLEKEKS